MRGAYSKGNYETAAFQKKVQDMIWEFAETIAEMEVEMDLVSTLTEMVAKNSALDSVGDSEPSQIKIMPVEDKENDAKLHRVLDSTISVCEKSYLDAVSVESDHIFVDELSEQLDREKQRLEEIFHHADPERIKNEVLFHAHDLIADITKN